MIVYENGAYEIRSDKPNENWSSKFAYVVDETKAENQELIAKITEHSPYIELIVEDGEIIDVIPIERPPDPESPLQPPTQEERIAAVEEALLILLMEV
jgi:hypothetical protein